jgi:ATP-dependent exoDNAse (exonuclease V) beta subunit
VSVADKRKLRPLTHVSILASAGSGKTFQLTNRYIQILARGAAPSSILASTFTRAAAGEIRDRILERLATSALSRKRRLELGQHTELGSLSKETVLDLLAILAHNLHRLQIRTLDSFFGTIVRCFALELGLPADARIADQDEDVRLRREAIRMMLDEGEEAAIIELLASLTEGSSERAVTETIDATVAGLYELYREADPGAWSAVPPSRMLSDEELDEAIEALREAVPSGPKRTINAHVADCERVERCRSNSSDDWKEFFAKGLAAKVADGSLAYYKKPIDDHTVAAYRDLLRHAHAVFRMRIITQTAATYELLELFDRCYRRAKHRNKVVTFADLTAALAAAELRGQLDEICFRIDARLQHVLLDEMQDTNIQQWNALRPIIDEIVSYPAEERSFFCVGDVKQSIYGWRDACPEVLSRIGDLLARPGGVTVIERQTLATSYRSAQAVIDTVNRVFANLETNAALTRYTDAARGWVAEFERHSTARVDLPGYVELRTVERADDGAKRQTMRLQRAADLVSDLYLRHRDAKRIGVLCRTNAAVSRVLYELGPTRRRIPATGRGGGPLTDAPAVNAILDLLRMVEHPDHTVAAFNVEASPLGPVIGLEEKETPPQTIGNRRAIAGRIRRRIADDGLARTIQGWVRAIAGDTDERQYRRCMQLIHLAQLFDARAYSRIDEFVHMVESRAVADPAESTVQVMTVHQSKGLEFDIVILPELEAEIAATRTLKVVYERDGDAGPIARIARHVSKDMWQTFPDLAPMFEQHIGRLAYESLCLLYVALTRARQGLYMLVDPPSERARTVPARLSALLLCALSDGGEIEPDQVVYSHGESAWLTPLKVVKGDPMAAQPTELGLNMPIAFAPTDGPLLRLANLVGDDKKTVGEALTLSASTAGLWGAAFCALLGEVDFFEDFRARRERLITKVARAVPSRDDGWAAARVDEFLRMLDDHAGLQEALSRGPRRASARVEHDVPFARLVDGELQQGMLQRVVVDDPGGVAESVEVFGFSHDKPATLEAAEERARGLRSLAKAWRAAASEQFGVAEDAISVSLVFIAVGYVVTVL